MISFQEQELYCVNSKNDNVYDQNLRNYSKNSSQLLIIVKSNLKYFNIWIIFSSKFQPYIY